MICHWKSSSSIIELKLLEKTTIEILRGAVQVHCQPKFCQSMTRSIETYNLSIIVCIVSSRCTNDSPTNKANMSWTNILIKMELLSHYDFFSVCVFFFSWISKTLFIYITWLHFIHCIQRKLFIYLFDFFWSYISNLRIQCVNAVNAIFNQPLKQSQPFQTKSTAKCIQNTISHL